MGSVNKERLEVELMTKLDNDLWSFVKHRYMLATNHNINLHHETRICANVICRNANSAFKLGKSS